MSSLTWSYGSHVRCDGKTLTLTLPVSLFRPDLWQRVLAWIQQRHDRWPLLLAPSRLMTAEAPGGRGPRWKQACLDALSCLIFLLLIPPDHSLVQVWQAIDWAAINRLCAPCYKNHRHGQRAWAPAQMVALLILFFVVPVMSERQLIQMVFLVPLYRWFCGFDLFTPLPDHSTLYTFRQRLGTERFKALFTWLVLRCQEAGLIGNDLLHYDMTLVRVSACQWTPYQRAVILSHALLRYLEMTQDNPDMTLAEAVAQVVAEVAVETVGSEEMKKNPEMANKVLKSRERWLERLAGAKAPALWQKGVEQAVQTYLEEAAAESAPLPAQPAARKARLKKVAKGLKGLLPNARGDLDARLGRVQELVFGCGYLLGFLVDHLRDVITVVQVVPANTAQQTQMRPALDQHRQLVGENPRAVAADSAQDYYPVHQYLDAQQIEGHIAPRKRGTCGALSSHHFVWDEQGRLLCPAGKVLTAGKTRKDGKTPFTASGCASCREKEDCLPKGQKPDGPRCIYLKPEAHQRLQQNREHAQTEAYKKAQAARFAREGLFGLARRLHHGRDMPYRSQPMNLVAGLMIGFVMNTLTLTRRRRPG
jgi:transposase